MTPPAPGREIRRRAVVRGEGRPRQGAPSALAPGLPRPAASDHPFRPPRYEPQIWAQAVPPLHGTEEPQSLIETQAVVSP